ncbi:hypothetical protein LJC22_05865 [Desulfosarcina sp. OttesenSCG-928-G10]|nr:hypothetical protein [Desulfosarcina sp. OttesenSCG-928-G10]MDL2320739.1 hypothetical protein [Desulfosarcina sp. OttesenSCG-928-B08]
MKKTCLAASLFLFLLSACTGSYVYIPENTRNYTIGQIQQATIGTPMITKRDATIIENTRWVGIAFAPGGFKTTRYYDYESTQEDLIYTGISGNTIKMTYKQFKYDFEIPVFFQDLQYDIGRSNVIAFRQYRIQVTGANNERIQFIVVSD